MKKFLAFGCSFTSYIWPTWADILAQNFDSYENWGSIGGGNQFIFNSIVEALVRGHIKENDTVGIMWTNVSREDRYVDHEWVTPGNIYTQEIYDKKFVAKFADTRGYYIRDLAVIYATEKLLRHHGCNFFFLSMVPIYNPVQYEHHTVSNEIHDLLKSYQPIIDQVRSSVYEVIFNFNWWSRPFLPKNLQKIDIEYNSTKTRKDLHPTPGEHLEYLDKILPEYKIDLNTRQCVIAVDNLVRNIKSDQEVIELTKPCQDVWLTMPVQNNIGGWIKRW